MAFITIPLVPPSVNHYWKHAVIKGKLRTYVSKEGESFLDAVAMFSRGQKVESKEYAVTYRVFLGKGDRGDVANFEKAIGDGLVRAGVIHSDDAISEYHQYKSRDRDNPRTEITVEAI